MTNDTRLLDVDGVDVSLGRRHRATRILHDVSLRLRAGEIVGLIGETGSGKTTLARTILGLNAPTAGTVSVAGTDVSALRGRELRAFRRAGSVQFVFQDPLRSLDPDLRVGAIVGEGLALRGELGGRRAGTRRARPGRPRPGDGDPASGPALGRPAPARRDRASARR
jgi:ABC-type dipeptide/oligopeptide/nickel transport system ATPase subunit